MATNSVDLSIVIVSYNTKNTTIDCLLSITKSLNRSDLAYEIIVVDNASTDGSIEEIQKFKPKFQTKPYIHIIQNSENIGFAKANNQAVKIAEGGSILLLNSDILVLEDAIENMYNYFLKNNHMHFLGAKLLNKDMTPQASSAPFYTLNVVFGALFLRGDYWGLTRSSPTNTIKTDWVSGACMLTKKEYYEKIHGFDENIFMYMDEVDMLYRAKKAGLKVGIDARNSYEHFESSSILNKKKDIQLAKSHEIFFISLHAPASICATITDSAWFFGPNMFKQSFQSAKPESGSLWGPKFLRE